MILIRFLDVIINITGFWFKAAARWVFVISVFCQCMFCDRRSAKLIIPAATAIFETLSMRINPPRS